jgi:hypothetical protein
MIVRFALVGLAVASLASPVRATEAPAGTAQAQSDTDSVEPAASKPRHHARMRRARHTPAAEVAAADPATADVAVADPATAASGASEDDNVAAPRPVRRHPAKPKIAKLLPPARPVELASLDPASPAVAEPNAPAVAAAPAAVEASAADTGVQATVKDSAKDSAKTPAFVSIMPPLRPSFEADQVNTQVASIDAPTPIIVTPDGSVSPMGRIVYVLPPARPGFAWDDDNGAALPGEAIAAEAPPPAQPTGFAALFQPLTTQFPAPSASANPPSFSGRGHNGLDMMIAEHARINGIPVELVHRVVVRESKYNPGAVGHGGALGLMQIKHATARALGYMGNASGLLDANTNLTYAVKYLAGAYRTAGGNFDRAVSYYARGYYYAAKQIGSFRTADRRRGQQEATAQDITAAQ